MKKIYFTLLVLFGTALNAQIINIPDANLKAWLVGANPQNQRVSYTYPALTYNTLDTNGDGEIQVSEAALVRYLKMTDPTFQLNIATLAGVEQFVNLKQLICQAFLDSFNPVDFIGLVSLELSYVSGTTLDFTPMINLKILIINRMYHLNSINLNGLTNLEVLSIHNSDDLASLDRS